MRMLTKKTTDISIAAALCLAILIGAFATAFSAETRQLPAKGEDLIRVKVYNLLEMANESHVVLLSDSDEKMVFPIWISPFEANAIYMELGGIKPFRPQTHELLKRIIEQLEGDLRHIVITHEHENVYYSKLIIAREGAMIEMDARPSDSIVLALKFNVPILVAKDLFAAKSIPVGDENGSLQKYGLTLQELSPVLAQYFSLGAITGVLVSDVRMGSQAEKDGLKTKDVIVEIDKVPVKGIDTIQNVLAKGAAETTVKIYRDNNYIFLTLHLKGI